MIEEIRGAIRDEFDQRYTIATVETIYPGTNKARVRMRDVGNRLTEVVISGVAQPGDQVYLLRFDDQVVVGLSSRTPGDIGSTTIAGGHTHGTLYPSRSELNEALSNKSDVGHTHGGDGQTIGGFTIGPTTLSSVGLLLHKDGFLSAGNGGTIPTAYGSYVGVWLGWDALTSKARASFYSDASNYLQWDGTKLLVKAANFALDTSGNITATNATLSGTVTATAGAIGGWTINSTYLAKDTGIDATSAGMSPTDYPFYAGAVHSQRSNAPFRVTPAGAMTATSGVIGSWTITSMYLYATNMYLFGGSTARLELGTTTDANTAGIAAGNIASAIAHWAGATYGNRASAPFRVRLDGGLTASNADITGTITATLGVIGGWTISSSDLRSPGGSIVLDAANSRILVGASSPITIDGASKYVRSGNYVAGVSGFNLDGADGSAEFQNVSVRGEFRTSVFVKGEVHADGGTVMIAEASVLAEAVTTR